MPYILRPPRPGDMGWVVSRHGVRYGEDYGWDDKIEALTAEIVATFVRNYDAKRERCWIAERDGENVGSVFMVKENEQVARLRLLLVEPRARGLGIGARLVDESVRFARAAGYEKVTLWTHSILTGARHIYQQAGFKLVAYLAARRLRQDAHRRDLGPGVASLGVADNVNERRQHGHPHGRRPSLRAELVRLGLRVAFKRQRAARTVEEVRRRLAMFGYIVPPPPRDTKVSKLDLDGVPAVHVTTPQSLDDRHLLYLHGGAHMSGSPGLYRDFTWRIADATRSRVTILDHRLAPEHPFPAALDDAIAAYRRLLSDGADPRRMSLAAIVGRRTGFFDAAATARRGPAAAGRRRGAVALDRSRADRPLAARNAKADPMIRSEETPRLVDQYLAGADPRTPYASPLYGDHTDLPPTLIQVGSDEVLLDDSVRMADRLRAAGCHVEIEVWPRMPHVWQLWAAHSGSRTPRSTASVRSCMPKSTAHVQGKRARQVLHQQLC